MPSQVVKRLLESNDPQLAVPETKVSKKRKQKTEKPCSEDALVAAHIRSLLVVDRKLKAKSANVTATNSNAVTKKQRTKLLAQSQAFGRTAAAQARTPPVPTFDKRRHAKETKKRRLVDIAKLLQKQSSSSKGL